MNGYESYHLQFKPLSPSITPLQSDTLFGHIAWAVRYLRGEQELLTFLNKFQDNHDAPLLISDGFPQGYLPKPQFKALPIDELDAAIAEYALKEKKEYDQKKQTEIHKALKSQSYLKIETMQSLQQSFSVETMLQASLEDLDWDAVLGEKKNGHRDQETIVMYHNTVNRVHNQVLEGFYQQSTHFYAHDYVFDVYLKTNCFSKSDLEEIFGFIEMSGFGKDKSTGKGKFKIDLKNENKLKEPADANAFMTLSHYVPNPQAPRKGYYRLMTKYGRLGGDFACSVIPDSKMKKVHPFKKPVIMTQPGSVFLGKPQLNYGLLLGGENHYEVHKYQGIRHYAYAYPLGLKVKPQEFH